MAKLDKKQETMIPVAAYAAAGKLPELKDALSAGLAAGWSVEELKDALVHLYAYCGFPRSLNALGVLMEAAKTRKLDSQPACFKPPADSLAAGTAVQTKLCGGPVKGALMDFAPAIDYFLKAHLFGDIFSSPLLDAKTRELVTVAALASIPGAEPQFRAHCGIARNAGWSAEEVTLIARRAQRLLAADPFPRGEKLTAHFTGDAWCAMLVKGYDTPVYNVTFAPGTRNDWHRHSIGQILLCTYGRGFYQERGKKARSLKPGDIVEIPANTDHWHGAAPDSAFAHIGLTPAASKNTTDWLEPVDASEYASACNGN